MDTASTKFENWRNLLEFGNVRFCLANNQPNQINKRVDFEIHQKKGWLLEHNFLPRAMDSTTRLRNQTSKSWISKLKASGMDASCQPGHMAWEVMGVLWRGFGARKLTILLLLIPPCFADENWNALDLEDISSGANKKTYHWNQKYKKTEKTTTRGFLRVFLWNDKPCFHMVNHSTVAGWNGTSMYGPRVRNSQGERMWDTQKMACISHQPLETSENPTWQAGTSPFLIIGNTSPNNSFSIVMLGFRGCNFGSQKRKRFRTWKKHKKSESSCHGNLRIALTMPVCPRKQRLNKAWLCDY